MATSALRLASAKRLRTGFYIRPSEPYGLSHLCQGVLRTVIAPGSINRRRTRNRRRYKNADDGVVLLSNVDIS
jgi:hypothetical protein